MRKQAIALTAMLSMTLTLSTPFAVPTWANTAPVKQQPGQSIAPKPPVTVPSTTTPSSPAFYVNGKDVTKQGEATYRAGVLYLPLESVVTGMGDSFTWITKPRVANVKTKSGKEVIVTIAKADVVVSGKNVPVSTLQLQGTSVRMQAKPVVINDMLYVPYDFFKNVLGYPVEINKNGSKENITVGQGAPIPTPVPLPTKPITIDPRYPLPTGTIIPQITSTWTSDKQKNMQILADELEFTNLGAGAVYSPYGRGATAIGLSANDLEKYDTSIQIDVWMGSEYTPLDHKIPYIAKSLFHFYFSQDGDKLWKIADDAFNGKNVSQYLNKMLTYNNRQVKLMNVKGSLVIIVGKPGIKYDKDWNVSK
ncbi:stalk domain-containing protein [Brevibacillus sp. SIMBA_040]|uniref:stalk domain-containing protein n=1 Tax=unclassified Brevibacillus TaxID=2684853 RepID=UPI00397E6039